MCILCYALRFNLSIAIVAMVDDTEAPSSESDAGQTPTNRQEICPSLVSPYFNDSYFIYLNATENPIESRSVQLSRTKRSEGDITFRWNEKDQGLVLASFFWGYMLSQFPSGLLAYKYGGKWVSCVGMIWTAFFGIAFPQAAIIGGRDFVLLIRFLQGLSSVSGMLINFIFILNAFLD